MFLNVWSFNFKFYFPVHLFIFILFDKVDDIKSGSVPLNLESNTSTHHFSVWYFLKENFCLSDKTSRKMLIDIFGSFIVSYTLFSTHVATWGWVAFKWVGRTCVQDLLLLYKLSKWSVCRWMAGFFRWCYYGWSHDMKSWLWQFLNKSNHDPWI